MLSLEIPDGIELWDELNGRFIVSHKETLLMEHSLVSISKWESKWHKPFLDKGLETTEETIHYIKCMTISKNVSDETFEIVINTPALIMQITDYINDPMTATTFANKKNGSSKKEIITSELIYYWMTAFNIPSEYSKWHINRLLTLIRVCGIKSETPKKMGRSEIYNANRALNAARKSKLGTRG